MGVFEAVETWWPPIWVDLPRERQHGEAKYPPLRKVMHWWLKKKTSLGGGYWLGSFECGHFMIHWLSGRYGEERLPKRKRCRQCRPLKAR